MKEIWKKVKVFISYTDKTMLFLCVAASCYGLVIVYSATLNTMKPGESMPAIFQTMLISIAIGLVVAVVISLFDFEFVTKIWPVAAAACIGLMILTLFIGVGPSASDNKAWIKLGSFFFQPSELAKAGFILTFSIHLNKVKDKINSIFNVILLGVHAMIPIGLVSLNGDDGSALIFVCIFVSMLFAAGLRFVYFFLGLAAAAGGFYIAWTANLIKGYQKLRFLVPFHPDENPLDIAFQQNQGLIAIGSGQMNGTGLFNGPFHAKVPASQNDFIISVAGEELGFIGCLAAIIILLAIILKLHRMSFKSNNDTGYLYCYGVASMIAGQTFINLGMCLKILPVIGITLPFFSSGGSSNICLYVAIGLALSVYRTSRTNVNISYKIL